MLGRIDDFRKRLKASKDTDWLEFRPTIEKIVDQHCHVACIVDNCRITHTYPLGRPFPTRSGLLLWCDLSGAGVGIFVAHATIKT